MKITYVNMKKEFPNIRSDKTAFSKWLSLDRLWNGKLLEISIKHHVITIDFRKNIVADLTCTGSAKARE